MANIVLRLVKGVPLTNEEVDGNFSNINIEVGNVIENVGILDDLSTDSKNNLVSSINELNANILNAFAEIDQVAADLANVEVGEFTGLDWTGNIIPINKGGTNADTEAQARINLGLEIGDDVQAWSQQLDDVSNASVTIDNILVGNGTTFVSVPFDSLVANVDFANIDLGLNLGTMSNQDANNVEISGGQIDLGDGNVVAQFFYGDGGLLSNIAATGGGGGGSGMFNTNISDSAGSSITNVLSNVYIVPSTAGLRYVLHSIHVTNIDGTVDSNVSGELGGTNYSELISFAHTVPVPQNSAVEMLKQPKILQPGDYIRMEAEDNDVLHVTITTEVLEDEDLFGQGVDLVSGGVFFDLYTATSDSVLESILLSNDNGTFDVLARVVWTDSSDVIQGYYCFDMVIPADSTVELLEKPKFIPNTFKVRVYANIGGRLEAMIAGKKITA